MAPPAKDAALPRPRLRLSAQLRDGRPICPGGDALAHLCVEVERDDSDSGGVNAGAAVEVQSISVEWYGTERLDPAWVKPAVRRDAQDTALPPGERYVARSPAGVIMNHTVVNPVGPDISRTPV